MDTMNILYAVLILGVLGAVFGLVLAIASKIFEVKADERLEPVLSCLPGANCGGCGFAGCEAYAKAICSGEAEIGRCAAGGQEAADKIASIMGVSAESMEKTVAFVRCAGGCVGLKAEYYGIDDCSAAIRVPGSGLTLCSTACLGFGNCAKACQFDAMHIINGVAVVDPDKCTGCLACADACPRKLIVPRPYAKKYAVACANKDKGAVTRANCTTGCIGCKICERSCGSDAVHVDGNLAAIDYSKCVSCGACAAKCPRKVITDFSGAANAAAGA